MRGARSPPPYDTAAAAVPPGTPRIEELGAITSYRGLRDGIRESYRRHPPLSTEAGRPRDQQAITACFAMEYLFEEDHTIDRPRQYEPWHDCRPSNGFAPSDITVVNTAHFSTQSRQTF